MTSGSFSTATAMALEPGEDIASQGDLFSMKLASLVQGLSQQTEAAMENLLPAVSEIGLSSLEITEDLNRTKEFEQERKSTLEGAREKIQQAACRVMDILSTPHYTINVSGDPASAEKENSDPGGENNGGLSL